LVFSPPPVPGGGARRTGAVSIWKKSPCIFPRRRNQNCIRRELNRAARYFMLTRSERITLNAIIT